jgi:cytochrome b6-f complex iron-sulfur subunit
MDTPNQPNVDPKPAAPAPAPQAAPKPAPAPAAKPAAAGVKKPKQDKAPENDPGIWRISRRNFFSIAGWAAFFAFLATSTIGSLRMMFPRILYEPPSAFKAGFPEDYIVGEVSEKYKDEYRVWVVRESEGFYALSAICTHLGCTPRWLASENKFKCPCHGSGYRMSGVNFEGPAPRPLERLKISIADDGQILIDRKIKFLFEKGEWTKPECYLKYS